MEQGAYVTWQSPCKPYKQKQISSKKQRMRTSFSKFLARGPAMASEKEPERLVRVEALKKPLTQMKWKACRAVGTEGTGVVTDVGCLSTQTDGRPSGPPMRLVRTPTAIRTKPKPRLHPPRKAVRGCHNKWTCSRGRERYTETDRWYTP